MKKPISALIIFVLLFSFVSCDKDKRIDGKWEMTLAQTEEKIIAHGPSQSESFTDYTDSVRLELILTAEDGRLTLEDRTGGKSYTGSYKKERSEKDEKNIRYSVKLESTEGSAIIAETETPKGEKGYTLIIAVGGYAISFAEIE